MIEKRFSGFLLHPISLPGKYGIGDLGLNAYKFVDFMVACNQSLWQVFPLGPTGYGDSPYQTLSAFAGNPLLISPERLLEIGLLSEDDLEKIPENNSSKIDYGRVIKLKSKLLKQAFKNFNENYSDFEVEFLSFVKRESYWLEDYSLFMAAKDYHQGALWTEWNADIAFREKSAMAKWKEMLKEEIEYHNFLQFIFDRQWTELKRYANKNNVKIVGDMPIFIAYDSADLWANKNLFTVNEEGGLEYKAGVPPDYFSPTGQLWGNPLYKWDVMKEDDFYWWRLRFSKLKEMVDIVRIDHFRGFEAYYEIPGDAPTAETGKWVKSPGKELFESVIKNLGKFTIIAEDLGVITPEVEELRDYFDFPGMRILQFAFGTGMEKKFLPHNYVKNTVVYTGSHDNDTTRGYFEKAKREDNDIYSFTQKYLNYYGDNICFELIRSAYGSVAKYVFIPMQDVLNLSSEARMNFPGTLGGNWTWRFRWSQITPNIATVYKTLSELYDRNNYNGKEEKVEE